MIGIFALAGFPAAQLRDTAQAVAARMASRPQWDRTLCLHDGVACGRVGPRRDTAAWTSQDGACQAWLDGFAFTPHEGNGHAAQPAGAGALASALLANGAPALLDFEGEFTLLVLDRNRHRLYAATDRFGTRTTYWYAAGVNLAIVSELRPLLDLGLLPRRLDELFLVSLLRFRKCRLGDRTLFAGVQVLPPGTVLEYDLDRPGAAPREHPYYRHQWSSESRSEEEWLEILAPVLRGAVRNACRAAGPPVALAISGGLDSRMLLGVLRQDPSLRYCLLSCGLPDSDEVRLAAEVAGMAGAAYANVDLGPADFLHWACTASRRNEEFDILIQGANGALHRAAAGRAGALMTGWDVDVPLRGTYLNDAALELDRDSRVPAVIDANWRLFSKAALGELLQDSWQGTVAQVDEWLCQLVSRLPAETPLDRYLQFIFQYEKRRLLMLRSRMIRFELESLTPFYNPGLQAWMAGIPTSMKAGNRLFARLLQRVAPDLAGIRYQRTMLPASVPVEYWPRAAELENQREALHRDIRIRTGVPMGPARHYTDFDEWLRGDPRWISFTDDLLVSRRSVLARNYLRPEIVRRLLDEHRAGVRSHRSQLVYLLSLELYLREYFA